MGVCSRPHFIDFLVGSNFIHFFECNFGVPKKSCFFATRGHPLRFSSQPPMELRGSPIRSLRTKRSHHCVLATAGAAHALEVALVGTMVGLLVEVLSVSGFTTGRFSCATFHPFFGRITFRRFFSNRILGSQKSASFFRFFPKHDSSILF